MTPDVASIIGIAIILGFGIAGYVIADALKTMIPRKVTFTHEGTTRQIVMSAKDWHDCITPAESETEVKP